MPRYLLLVVLLTVAVPFQAALAVSASQHTALEQCHHDANHGHDGQGKPAGSHCLECCAAAIAGTIVVLPSSPFQGAVTARPGSPPLAELPARLDRPPRSL